jgi:5-methylcytosine-specific restriction endonuclease McrA
MRGGVMPIKDTSIYPREWRQIRRRILERAGNRCEGSPRYPDCRAWDHQEHPVTGSLVVLTVAHLDHDPGHNDDKNLRAMCQRCHLTYDARFHALNARKTRRLRKAMGDLFEWEPQQ